MPCDLGLLSYVRRFTGPAGALLWAKAVEVGSRDNVQVQRVFRNEMRIIEGVQGDPQKAWDLQSWVASHGQPVS